MSLSLLSAALLAFSGMLGLCLGLERHYKQLLAAVPAPSRLRALRVGGWLATAASLAASVSGWGWAMGPVGWFAMVSVAGMAVVLWAPYAIRTLLMSVAIGWLLVGVLAALR
jgi:hypothetical protein